MTRSTAALLLAATLLVVAQDARAQARQTLEILEPAAWRSDATRGIVVRQKRGLRVVGVARSAAGIDRVTLNGADAALTGTGDEVRFVGYAAPDAGAEEVEIQVHVGNVQSRQRRQHQGHHLAIALDAGVAVEFGADLHRAARPAQPIGARAQGRSEIAQARRRALVRGRETHGDERAGGGAGP